MLRNSVVMLAGAVLLITAGPLAAAQSAPPPSPDMEWCRTISNGRCSPGQCGKRRGDWYGARQPVMSRDEAREKLTRYYSDDGKTVGEVTERRWRYEADIHDARGTVVDRVMIDKRSGRIRSVY